MGEELGNTNTDNLLSLVIQTDGILKITKEIIKNKVGFGMTLPSKLKKSSEEEVMKQSPFVKTLITNLMILKISKA